MKKCVLIIFILSVFCLNASSQDNNDSISNNAVFKLFPTQNMWTFIKLDTRNGRMWQVQYGMKSDERLEAILSDEYRVPEDKGYVNRFTLYPTNNIYTFLLLDQIDGRVWQTQWSTKSKERVVLRIY